MGPPFIQQCFVNALSKFGKCDETTPNSFPNIFEEAKQGEEIQFTCGDCHSLNPLPICYSCTPDDVMPVVNELFRDVPDDDEGNAERSSEQRLMRVHRNLGHLRTDSWPND